MSTEPDQGRTRRSTSSLGDRRRRSRVKEIITVLGLLCIGATAFLAGTFRNDQPEQWHPDEPSKVDQLITREWNFNHPRLLLSATRLALLKESFQEPEYESRESEHRRHLLLAGRRTSAWFAALTALALAGMTIELFGLQQVYWPASW